MLHLFILQGYYGIYLQNFLNIFHEFYFSFINLLIRFHVQFTYFIFIECKLSRFLFFSGHFPEIFFLKRVLLNHLYLFLNLYWILSILHLLHLFRNRHLNINFRLKSRLDNLLSLKLFNEYFCHFYNCHQDFIDLERQI